MPLTALAAFVNAPAPTDLGPAPPSSVHLGTTLPIDSRLLHPVFADPHAPDRDATRRHGLPIPLPRPQKNRGPGGGRGRGVWLRYERRRCEAIRLATHIIAAADGAGIVLKPVQAAAVLGATGRWCGAAAGLCRDLDFVQKSGRVCPWPSSSP
jgi:hypothetical protein